ncbi:DCXR [Cordylochernes scorpioides]|uniref:DCXR n=1 Tax=Cordylochernes scorpioides TaxID=51811 RepID=A0ABY6L3V2_9ARAC|nr:DCXR [Cordylochernes scorpioides]
MYGRQFPGVETVVVDLSDWESTKTAVEDCGPIDLLVNNAGITILQPVGHVSEGALDLIFAINVKAPINIAQRPPPLGVPMFCQSLCSSIYCLCNAMWWKCGQYYEVSVQVVAEGMRQRGKGGAIVSLSSQAALVALPNHAAYCASKAALDQATKVMALELGPHKIRVNSVCPTVVDTPMGRAVWNDPTLVRETKAKIPLGRFCGKFPSPLVVVELLLISHFVKIIRQCGHPYYISNIKLREDYIHVPRETPLSLIIHQNYASCALP